MQNVKKFANFLAKRRDQNDILRRFWCSD